MFKPDELIQIKKELFDSLIRESKKSIRLLRSTDQEKANTVLNAYKSSKSLAGLELLNTSISEFFYFSDILLELDSNKDNFFELKEFLIGGFKDSFGSEDFRFMEIEKDELNFLQFRKIILGFQKTARRNFWKSKKTLLLRKKNNFKTYFVSDSDPSAVGTDVQIQTSKTPQSKIEQIHKAKEILADLWKEGFTIFEILTDEIHIVQSPALVSYSHFHEQGISYINFIDRSLFQSIDDLIHENAHHHLNLILKKHKIMIEENTEDIFYSPWRKELRSLYAILHAVFTFSYGSFLFFQMMKSRTYIETETDFSMKEIYFRFLEETYSVEYSLYDLNLCVKKKYFSAEGIFLIQYLKKRNEVNLKFITSNKQIQLSKSQKQSIEKLRRELQRARKEFILI